MAAPVQQAVGGRATVIDLAQLRLAPGQAVAALGVGDVFDAVVAGAVVPGPENRLLARHHEGRDVAGLPGMFPLFEEGVGPAGLLDPELQRPDRWVLNPAQAVRAHAAVSGLDTAPVQDGGRVRFVLCHRHPLSWYL